MNPKKIFERDARVRIWLAFSSTKYKTLKHEAKFSKISQFFMLLWNYLDS